MCKWAHPLTGALLVGLGIIYLGLNFGMLPAQPWEMAWKIWPIFLVLLGVHKLMGGSCCGQ